MDWSLRPAEPGDAEELVETLLGAFEGYRAFAPPAWDPPDEAAQLPRLREEIARPDALTVMADGAGHVHVVPRDDWVHLRHLFVRPPWWGSGLAVALHDEAVAFIAGRPARLLTPAGHARARRFYEREGWTLHGEGEDAHFGMPLAEYRRAAPIAIRTARRDEAAALEALQRRASMVWPAYREQLAAHPEAVEVPADQLAGGAVRVAEQAGRVVGFAVVLPPENGSCELDGLFVEPALMSAGIGRALVEDGVRAARLRGAEHLDVVANPHAVGFYERVGFTGGEEVPTRFGPALRMRRSVG